MTLESNPGGQHIFNVAEMQKDSWRGEGRVMGYNSRTGQKIGFSSGQSKALIQSTSNPKSVAA